MVYLRFHLPILLPSYSIVTSNLIRLCSIGLIFFSQIIVSSSYSSKSNDPALTIANSIDDYLCRNYVLTCFFRRRHHQPFDNEKQFANCKSLLILHSCFHYDTDTIRMCQQSTLNPAKLNLNKETPTYCFTSSVYKTFYAQHLRSIASSRTTFECQIFVLIFLFISFVIKIKACC